MRLVHVTEESLLKRHSPQSFTLNHFQGTNPITYATQGWLRACRENPVARGVNIFLQDSQRCGPKRTHSGGLWCIHVAALGLSALAVVDHNCQ